MESTMINGEKVDQINELSTSNHTKVETESIERCEIYIACKENSLWAQYIIEFFKFVGFCVSKASLGDLASNTADDKKVQDFFNTGKLNLKLINHVGHDQCSDEVTIETFSPLLVVNVNYCEEVFSNADKREIIMNSILDELSNLKYYKEKEEYDIEALKYLLKLYDKNGMFWHLYCEGLLKSTRDYYNASGENNEITGVIVRVCGESKKSFAACINDLYELKEDCPYENSRYIRYVKIFLSYKLNELKQVIDKRLLFLPEKMLEEINDLTKSYPNFIRAYYLGAQICRKNLQNKRYAVSYIDLAIEKAEKTKKIPTFLYYQKAKIYEENEAKFFEEDDNEIGHIKGYYESARNYDNENDLAQFKYAKYLYYCTNEKDEAIKILKDLEDKLVDDLDKKKLLPKRRINGYECCVLLARVENDKRNYVEEERYYIKALELAIREIDLFNIAFGKTDNLKNAWDTVFHSCMPVTPISNEMERIYNKQEEYEKARKLKKLLDYEHEEDLRKFWSGVLELNNGRN